MYAPTAVELRKFNPAEPRDPHTGKWMHLGGAASAVARALEELGGTEGHASFDDGRYFDWSTRIDHGNYRMEIGAPDQEPISLDMNKSEMRQLASALSVTRLRDSTPAPDTSSEHGLLLATLAHTGEHGAVYFNDADYGERYIDWSTSNHGGGYSIEAGDADGATVQMDLSSEEFTKLYASLALSLATDNRNAAGARSYRFPGGARRKARQAESHLADV